MSASITYSSTCPCLVERAMMPPSIVSEAYYALQDEPSSPQTESPEPIIPVHHPSLLTIKDDLHDEIARIFSNAPKPSLPPFKLPSYPVWDSPPPSTGRTFTSTGTVNSAGTASSRGSSFGSNDSLLSPFKSCTPARTSDFHHTMTCCGGSAGQGALVGLGLTGLYKQDGTPFDGTGSLQPVIYRKGSRHAPSPLYFYSGAGLGFYREQRVTWQWDGEQEVLFDADGDHTLVDEHDTRSCQQDSRTTESSYEISSNDLDKDSASGPLDYSFSNSSTDPSPTCSYPREHDAHNEAIPHHSSPVTRRLFSTSPISGLGYDSSSMRSSRGQRVGLAHTVPLPLCAADVFYDMNSTSSANSGALIPVVDRPRFRAADYFQLRKDADSTLAWSLPPIPCKPKKAKL